MVHWICSKCPKGQSHMFVAAPKTRICLQAPKSPATTGRLAIEPQDRNQIVLFGTYSVNSVVCVMVLPGVSLQHKPDASYPFFTVFGCSPRCGTLILGGTWAPVAQNLETQGPCAMVLKVPSCASSLMLAQLVLAITASIAIAAPADRKQT